MAYFNSEYFFQHYGFMHYTEARRNGTHLTNMLWIAHPSSAGETEETPSIMLFVRSPSVPWWIRHTSLAAWPAIKINHTGSDLANEAASSILCFIFCHQKHSSNSTELFALWYIALSCWKRHRFSCNVTDVNQWYQNACYTSVCT